MDTILLLTHTEPDGSLGKAAREALGAAQELAKALQTKWMLGIFGAAVQPAADAVAGCGAARLLGVAGSDFAPSRYATDAAASEALVRASGATIVLAAATSRMARCMAGVAHRLGGRIDTHVTSLAASNSSLSVQRWFYRQRIEARLARAERPWVILLDPGCHAPWEGASGKASVEAVTARTGASRTEVMGTKSPKSDQQTIRPEAKLLFVAGAGWTKKQSDGKPHVEEAERLILGFLNASQASLGSSKSLVDQSGEGQAVLGFMSHLNQVGQTGSTPRHPKGLSTCCHGEEPHVVGWRFIHERRAINLDPGCGWARGKTDVLYLADAFAVMAKVNELLGKK